MNGSMADRPFSGRDRAQDRHRRSLQNERKRCRGGSRQLHPSDETTAVALRRSMTPDQVRGRRPDQVRGRLCDCGSEMACHPELARRHKIDIRFCDPHAPRPRGSNENTIGPRRCD